MKLEITHPHQNASIVSFPGTHLDASNVKAFRDAMQPVTEAADIVLLDMSKLAFVDSSGLGALLSCLRAMNTKGGQLRLFAMTRPVQGLFELVRMHRIFSIYNSEAEAMEDVKATLDTFK